MEHGGRRRVGLENQQALGQCAKAVACATALFNLGFGACLPAQSVLRPRQGLAIPARLHARYPQTPLDMQGQIWVAFIHNKLALEETQRRLQADLRTREADLRTREATIRSLQGRLKRVRDIDLQMEKKSRTFCGKEPYGWRKNPRSRRRPGSSHPDESASAGSGYGSTQPEREKKPSCGRRRGPMTWQSLT